MTPDQIQVAVGSPCGFLTFDNVNLAIEYLRMLAHEIAPEQFIAMVKALFNDPDIVNGAKEMVRACMGTGI